MTRVNLRIKPKLLLLLFLINLTSTLTFSLYYYNRRKSDIIKGIDEELMTGAYAVSYIMPPDFHARIEDKNSVSKEQYMKYVRILTRYAQQAGLTYLYTCMKFGDTIVFTMSSATVEEIKQGTLEDFFEDYSTAPASLYKVFAERKIYSDEYTDRYGTFRSVFVPLTAPNGKVYVAGADISLDFLKAQLRSTLFHTAAIGVVIFLISFVAGYVMIDRIVKPLTQLTGYTRAMVKQDFKLHEDVLGHMQEISEARKGEVSDLANALHGMYTMLQAYIVNLQETTAAREAVESELRIARSIQTSLLPRTFPPFPDRKEFDLHAVNVAAKQVAGDFYDFYFISEDEILVTIADVSGKGVPAALLMAVTRTLLKNLALGGLKPGEVLKRANDILVEDNDQGMFVSLFLALYDTRTGKLTYANAGHNPPYHLGADGKLQPPIQPTGPVLGVFEEQQFGEKEIQLGVRDMLVLYTDGVTEAHSPDGELYGNKRFEDLLRGLPAQAPSRVCEIIAEAVDDFQRDNVYDDITLAVLRRNV